MPDSSPLPARAAPPEDDDAPLVARARTGDETAFGELMQRHYGPVFRRVVSFLRHEEDARDLCQDIWLAVWRELPRFRGDSRFQTWLFPLVTRRAIDHLRKRRRWYARFLPFLDGTDEAPAFEPADPSPSAPSLLERGERREAFEQALASLPPELRAVLALRELDGLSYADIAATLDWPAGTVMSRLHHARRLLTRKLKDLPCA
jgi:RNA polymerase sigma-70 factor (ECF subfamily)